jgi:hypothetical protein
MEAGHQGVQKLLIESGGKVGDAKKSVEKLFAAVSAGDIPLTQSLVRSGTAISSVDKDNRTALHHAVAKGDLALIDALIEEGAKLDAVDNYGLTPLGEVRADASSSIDRARAPPLAPLAHASLRAPHPHARPAHCDRRRVTARVRARTPSATGSSPRARRRSSPARRASTRVSSSASSVAARRSSSSSSS